MNKLNLKELQEWCDQHPDYAKFKEESQKRRKILCEDYKFSVDDLNNFYIFLFKNQWTNVQDNLPPCQEDGSGIYVLTINKYGKYEVAVYSLSDLCWYNADDVTHWMHLPNPPKPKT